MDPRYYTRPHSPSSRRLVPSERASTGTFPAAYDDDYSKGRSARGSHSASRGSVDRSPHPQSAQSYAHSSSTSSRSGSGYNSYSGRPRRSTLTEADGTRPPTVTTSLSPIPIRSRPVIHSAHDRPSSPLARSWDDRSSAYYVTPAATAPRREHKKTYSIDSTGHAKLVDERDIDPRRRESLERRGHRTHGAGGGRKAYHLSGPLSSKQEIPDDYYSYTDAAGMFSETEPYWRPRRGSIDRGSRPTSMLEPTYGQDPRRSRDLGPPPSTRGFDKINDKLNGGLNRGGSLREHGRSSSRDRSSGYAGEPEYSMPHRSATARPAAIHQSRDDRNPYYEDRPGRSASTRYEDPDVAVRGFGIRNSSVDRFGRRGSDESPERSPIYTTDPIVKQPDVNEYIPSPTSRDDRRERDGDHRDRDYVNRERDRAWDRERDRERDRDHRRDTDRDRRDSDEREHRMSGALPAAAAAATAAYGANEALDRHSRDRRYEGQQRHEDHDTKYLKLTPSDSEPPRERHYESEKDRRDDRMKESRKESVFIDPDEDYRHRVKQEMERNGKAHRDRDSDSDRERHRTEREARERGSARDAPRERSGKATDIPPPPPQQPRAVDRREERSSNLFGGPYVQEPGELQEGGSPTSDKKVKIVDPPRESPPPPRSILKPPTEKFPEDPNPIREGVAPLKDAKKGKDIPQDARWTKIDRRLVNPAALDEAKERYEERMDCVIVLRVLTKDEIQKLANRTREIREEREYGRDRRDRYYERDQDRDHDHDRGDRGERRRHHRRGGSDSSGDSYDSYEDDHGHDRHARDRAKLKAIEAPPTSSAGAIGGSAPVASPTGGPSTGGDRRDPYLPGTYPVR